MAVGDRNKNGKPTDMKKPHRALATVAEFKAASQLPLSDRISWWKELVKNSKK